MNSRAWPLVGLFATLYYLSYLNVGLNLGDEGLIVHSADRVAQGDVPWLDFSCFYWARYYIYGFLFHLFGPHLLVTRLAFLVIRVMVVILAFLLARSVLTSRWALATTFLVALASGPWHKGFNPLVLALGIGALWRLMGRAGRGRALVFGVTVGLAACFREVVAVALVGGFSVIILAGAWTARRGGTAILPARMTLLWSGLGLLLGLTPLMAHLAYIVSQSSPAFGLRALNTHLSTMLAYAALGADAPGQGPSILLYLAGPLALVAGLVAAVALLRAEQTRERNAKLLVLVVVGAVTNSQVLQRMDVAHLLQNSLPPILLACFLLERLASALPGRLALLPLALPLALGVGLGLSTDYYVGNVGMRRERGTILDLPRARVVVSDGEAMVLSELVGRIRRESLPHECIFVVPYASMIYFLAERCNPTGLQGLHWGKIGLVTQRRMVGALSSSPVSHVVYEEVALDNREERRFRRQAPVVYRYLMGSTYLVKRIGPFQLRRPPARGAGEGAFLEEEDENYREDQ